MNYAFNEVAQAVSMAREQEPREETATLIQDEEALIVDDYEAHEQDQ